MSAKEIKRLVAQHWKITVGDLSSPRRPRSLTRPRTIAMGLCRMLTSLSYPKIGQSFNRDHTTVIYAVRRFSQWLEQSPRDVLDTIRHVRASFVATTVDPRLKHLVPLSSSEKDPDRFVEATADLRPPQPYLPGVEKHGHRRSERS